MSTKIAISLDVDWMPDFVIEEVAQLLIDHKVKATWFVTHASPVWDALRRRRDLFELGIHPSFKEGSSHGANMTEVVKHCLDFVPEAVSARSHGLIQSDYLWRHYLGHTPIRRECSTYLGHAPCAHATPFHWDGDMLVRIPFVYQDNLEMARPAPVWDAETFLDGKNGMQMFNFHPRYIYTNARTSEGLEAVRRANRSYTSLTRAELDALRNPGVGARTMFVSLVEYLAQRGGGWLTRDIEPD